jgi:hypothetical protein
MGEERNPFISYISYDKMDLFYVVSHNVMVYSNVFTTSNDDLTVVKQKFVHEHIC